MKKMLMVLAVAAGLVVSNVSADISVMLSPDPKAECTKTCALVGKKSAFDTPIVRAVFDSVNKPHQWGKYAHAATPNHPAVCFCQD